MHLFYGTFNLTVCSADIGVWRWRWGVKIDRIIQVQAVKF